MPDYAETLRFLYSLQTFGIKLGLENTEQLLAFLGNPQRRFSSIHVAGTNGKGSTASLVASVLTAAGFKTGLYTSPHLVDFSERIRINGVPIPVGAIVGIAEKLRPEVERLRATFFEATTALAFEYFARSGVEIAVVETGLGGRLDSTNVLKPLLSVITTIELDHTEHLGHDIKSVAREKGGIIKRNTPCVVGVVSREAYRLLKELAFERGSPIVRSPRVARHTIRENSSRRLSVDMTVSGEVYPRLAIGLLGRHQIENAKTALVALRELGERSAAFDRISRSAVREGLRTVTRNAGIRGRFEVISRRPLVILDVGHNHAAFQALKTVLGDFHLRKLIVVFGVMKDKDWRAMIRTLRPFVRTVVAVEAATDRALPSAEIVEECLNEKIDVKEGRDVMDGVRIALDEAKWSDTILVAGSHYVVGEAIQALEREKARLDKKQEI